MAAGKAGRDALQSAYQVHFLTVEGSKIKNQIFRACGRLSAQKRHTYLSSKKFQFFTRVSGVFGNFLRAYSLLVIKSIPFFGNIDK